MRVRGKSPLGTCKPGIVLVALTTSIPLLVAVADNHSRADAMRLFDFSAEPAAEDWLAINDAVMGGVSIGSMRSTRAGTAEFVGRVSLENDGGFASVRSRDAERDLRGYSGLELRVRGDGRVYKVNLRTESSFDGVLYRASFATEANAWQTRRLPFTEFLPSFRGRPVPDAPPLDLSRVRSMGLLISDRQAGLFRLEVAWIGVYREGRQ